MGLLGPAIVLAIGVLGQVRGSTGAADRDSVRDRSGFVGSGTVSTDGRDAESDAEPAGGPAGGRPGAEGGDDGSLSDADLLLLLQVEEAADTASVASNDLAPAAAQLDRLGASNRETTISQALIAETVPRTLGEAVAGREAWATTRRTRLPDDRLVVRGRSGSRVALRLDGARLQHPLSTVLDDRVQELVDPWMVGEADLEAGADLGRDSDGAAGAFSLSSRTLNVGRGIRTEIQGDARSGDRSLGGHAALEVGLGFAALRIAGAHADFGRARVGEPLSDEDGDEKDQPGANYRRSNLSVRAQVGDSSVNSPKITGGFERDALEGLQQLADGTAVIDRSRRRWFGRFDFTGEKQSLELIAAQERHQVDANDGVSRFEARGNLSWDFGDVGALAGGDFEIADAQLGSARGQSEDGESLSTSALAGLSYESALLQAALKGRFVHAHAERRPVSGGMTRNVEGRSLLTEGRVEVALGSKLALQAGWSQSFHLPSLGDWLLLDRGGSKPLGAERSFTVDFGPSLRHENFVVSVLGYLSWVSSSLEPTPLGLTTVEDARLRGVEARARWSASERLSLGAGLAWSAGNDGDDRPLSGQTGITAQGDVRYELGFHQAFFELSIKGGAPTERRSFYDRALEPNARLNRWINVEARGGGHLGAGFELFLALENALDAHQELPGSNVAQTGIDLRVALRHVFD